MADINNSDPETKKQPPGNYFDQTMRVELNDTPIIDCTSSHHGPTQPKHWRERERERERERAYLISAIYMYIASCTSKSI